MKVKIGNVTYDPEVQPIMVILTEKDKENIKNMYPDAIKYCTYPRGSNPYEILEWMKEE